MTAINALVPFLSVILGAAITNWFSIRQRQRTLVDDRLNDAIAAVSLAISTISYVPHYGKWHEAVSEKEPIELEKEVAREATLNHMRALAAARDAVAGVPYQPVRDRFLDEPVLYFQDPRARDHRRTAERQGPLGEMFKQLHDLLPRFTVPTVRH